MQADIKNKYKNGWICKLSALKNVTSYEDTMYFLFDLITRIFERGMHHRMKYKVCTKLSININWFELQTSMSDLIGLFRNTRITVLTVNKGVFKDEFKARGVFKVISKNLRGSIL